MRADPCPAVAVLAADVGNSKTDLALVDLDGTVRAAVRGPTASHQRLGLPGAVEALEALAYEAAARAGLAAVAPLAQIAVQSAAGADFSSDVRMLRRACDGTTLAAKHHIVNDCFGALRAGTERTWGVAVICGSGMNCAAVGPTGRVARFDALGEISGDWGGGRDLGSEALAAAVRAQDGRGPQTLLARTVPDHFGLPRPRAVTHALYRERIPADRVRDLAPLVFAAAEREDRVAIAIIDRFADEVVAWAAAAIRRAGLVRLDPHVVLAGGVFRAEYPRFYERIAAGIALVSPRATIRRLSSPPVVGAALLGFDLLDGGRAPAEVERRIRASLTDGLLAANRVDRAGRLVERER